MVRPKFLLSSHRNGEAKVNISGRKHAVSAVGEGLCGTLALEREGKQIQDAPCPQTREIPWI